jgi:hypothetical protein
MNQRNMTTSNPHVQELITRFTANQDIDSDFLHQSEAKLMRAAFMEVLDNADWTPTPRIEALLIAINAKLKYWEQMQPS